MRQPLDEKLVYSDKPPKGADWPSCIGQKDNYRPYNNGAVVWSALFLRPDFWHCLDCINTLI
jgi:hypothetical protein